MKFLKKKNGFNHQEPIIDAIRIGNKIRDWLHESINYEFISIGENCNSSWYLKEMNLKQNSYPFDWIFSSPSITLDAITNKFNDFLNREYIVSKGGFAGHSVYHESLFNHRNPLSSQKDYDYYVRCCERFLDILEKNNPILFICTVIMEPEKRPKWSNGFVGNYKLKENRDNEFDLLQKKITKLNNNAKFLFIKQYTEGYPSINLDKSNINATWISITSKGSNNGVKFLEAADETIIKALFCSISNAQLEKCKLEQLVS